MHLLPCLFSGSMLQEFTCLFPCIRTRNRLRIGSNVITNELVIPILCPLSLMLKYLVLQGQTMQMMYEIIAKEIKSAKLKNAHPTDYLNFYCLGNREEPQEQLDKSGLPSSNGNSVINFNFITHTLLYDEATNVTTLT